MAIAAGFILSIISVLKLCASCSDVAAYSIFGINFSWFGVGFFLFIAFLQAAARRSPLADLLVLLFLFSAAGAEVWFLWLQKFVIERWCPICVAISAVVFFGCAVKLNQMLGYRFKSPHKTAIAILMIAAIGFGGAVLGVKNNADATAQPDLFLGNKESATTIYFVTDWFCPGCRRSEARIEQIFPELARRTRISFVDFPVHKDTLNFTPFNLQFLYFEKDKYLALRKTLYQLAQKTNKPTPEEVQAAVAPLGVRLRELSYSDVLFGMKANMAVYDGWHLESTPSVVVTNTKTKKTKTLVGEWKIRERAIKAAIVEVEKN